MKTPFYPVLKGMAITIVSGACLIAATISIEASTFLVYNSNDSGAGSLRQAIANNHTFGGGNTIAFSNIVAGTITLTSGELLISDNLTIIGPGPGVLAVDGNYPAKTNRVFHIGPGINVSISGLSIQNGFLPGFSKGPGIYNDHSTLTVSNCDFNDNTMGYPGGSGGGGGIYNDGATSGSATLTVVACIFDGNDPGAGDGGGIYNAGESGGTATLTVSACTFIFNGAEEGGGIYNGGTSSGNAMTTVSACTFYQNSAIDGGGIFNDSQSGTLSATLAVSSCTFSGNTVTYDADSIYNFGGTLTIGNTILQTSGSRTNLAGYGAQFSYGYNLASDNGGGLLSNIGDQINTDAKLGGISSNNGGPTPTMIPLPGSPAIDQGRPDVVPNLTRHTDQRGRYRPFDDANVPNAPGSDGTDIGAVEVSPAHNVVGATSDPMGDSLRYCLLDAQPGDTITFSNGVAGTITLTAGELLINKDLTIQGPGANVVSISGNNVSRVIEVANNTVSISGLTIQNGVYTNNDNHGETLYGGGVLNAGQLTLRGCSLIQNSVSGVTNVNNGGVGGSAQGGAIYNLGGLALDGCAFAGNSATGAHGSAYSAGGLIGPGGYGGKGQGGGVYNTASGTLTIVNSTFASNNVTGGAGGSGSGTAINAGGGNANGGAVYNLGTLTVLSTTVSGNTGTGGIGAGFGVTRGPHGSGNGGLSAGGGSFSVSNTIVAGNSGNTAPDAEGTFSSGGFNLIGIADQSVGFSSSNTPPDQAGTAGSPVNPLLGPFQNNGGRTATMALLFGSPAIDQGKSFGLTTDQRGEPRPFDWPLVANAAGGDGSDIGAFERGRPRLNIQQAGNAAVLSWPSYYGNGEFSLQSATGVAASGSWVLASGSPGVVGSQYQQTNSPIAGNQYFRLKSN
jgi:hypothetical protein